MTPYEIIKKKRDGQALTKKEIEYFVSGYTKGEIPSYQMSALLMAIFFQQATKKETEYLTTSYVNSGKTLDFSSIKGPKIDKHSTGGVGDKVSLIVAPLVACLGVNIPMISGRGLGHTGGTLDKLESIPGFKVNLSIAQFKNQVKKIGVAIVSQSPELAPADGKIYALRDATATVESIPLVVASIMSKKLAEGIDGLVLDVKCGNGAFMEDINQAQKMAQALVATGKAHGCRTKAIISDMNQPLGRTVGNALEVKEAIQFLKGEKTEGDLEKVVLTLASHMLVLGKRFKHFDTAAKKAKKALHKGKGLAKMKELIQAQGGNPSVCDEVSLLDQAPCQMELKAHKKGYIQKMETRKIGALGVHMGAGRKKMGEDIDHTVGFEFFKKIGDKVKKGELLAIVHTKHKKESYLQKLRSYIKISSKKPKPPRIIKSKIP